MSHCQFDPELKFECLSEIVGIVREGDLTHSDYLKVSQHIACFAGSAIELYLQKNEPDYVPDNVIMFSQGDESIMNDEAFCDFVEQIQERCESNILAYGDTPAGIPWSTILDILLPMLFEWLANRE